MPSVAAARRVPSAIHRNIFRRIVVHLAVCFDVIDDLDDRRASPAQAAARTSSSVHVK